jgi:hypothetical protein
MAESKFDKLFQNADAEPEAAPEKAPRRRAERQPPASTSRPLGRPPGKRSDPAWKQFSVLLKRETQREAASILRGKDEGLDLSGLVQNLLESWIKRQKS